MNKRKKYSPEVRERAVRMVFEHEAEHESQGAAMLSIASKLGCTTETLRKWVRQAERDQGRRAGLTSDERERLKMLERENREVRRPTRSCARHRRILPRRSSTATGKSGCRFIEAHRDAYGVEPSGEVLPITPLTY